MLRTIIVGSFLLLAVPTVTEAADVRVDYDRHKDFAKYRTFVVDVGPLVSSDGKSDEHNSLAVDRLREAVTHEFLSRGLEPADGAADLLVRVSNREATQTAVISSGMYPYPWYGRRAFRRFGVWGGYGYPYYDDVWTRRYLEGTLTVDIVERASGALVYRAQVTDEVGGNLDKHVVKTMDQAFKKFPVKEQGR